MQDFRRSETGLLESGDAGKQPADDAFVRLNAAQLFPGHLGGQYMHAIS